MIVFITMSSSVDVVVATAACEVLSASSEKKIILFSISPFSVEYISHQASFFLNLFLKFEFEVFHKASRSWYNFNKWSTVFGCHFGKCRYGYINFP